MLQVRQLRLDARMRRGTDSQDSMGFMVFYSTAGLGEQGAGLPGERRMLIPSVVGMVSAGVYAMSTLIKFLFKYVQFVAHLFTSVKLL